MKKLFLYLFTFSLFFIACENKGKNSIVVDTLESKVLDTTKAQLAVETINKKSIDSEVRFPIKITICSDNDIGIYKIYEGKNFYLKLDNLIGDCQVPYLKTFDYNGTPIDSFIATTGSCHNDCGYYCSEYFTLDENLVFSSVDSITNYPCDELGEDRTKKSTRLLLLEGKINEDGSIEKYPNAE